MPFFENDEASVSFCGKTIGEIEEMMERLTHRAVLTKEHQRMTRHIFDVLWPTAIAEKTEEAWGCTQREIDKIVEFIVDNKRAFPNHQEHIDQWNSLKEVAKCCKCATTYVCTHCVCPNK